LTCSGQKQKQQDKSWMLMSLNCPGKENYQEGLKMEMLKFSSDCKQHFRRQYFEAIDLIVM